MSQIPPQTVKPYPQGASSIYQAGIANRDASINKQLSLIGATKGGQSSVTLPPFSVPYKDVGAGNNTATANYTNGVQTILTSNENAKYDMCVGQGPSCTLAQSAGSKRTHRNKRKRRKRTNKRKYTNKRIRRRHTKR